MQPGLTSHLRIMVADSNSNMLGVMHSLLFNAGIRHVKLMRSSNAAFRELKRQQYDAIFVADSLTPHSGIDLTIGLRADESGPNHRTPVILIADRAERSYIEYARDSGISEFIRKPVTGKVMQQRLRVVVENPREFITAPVYIGPDRRRRAVDLPPGKDRRRSARRQGLQRGYR